MGLDLRIQASGSNLTYNFHIISVSNFSTVTHRKAFFKAYVCIILKKILNII